MPSSRGFSQPRDRTSSPVTPALQVDFLPTEPPRKPVFSQFYSIFLMLFPLIKMLSFLWGLFSPIISFSDSAPRLSSSWSIPDFLSLICKALFDTFPIILITLEYAFYIHDSPLLLSWKFLEPESCHSSLHWPEHLAHSWSPEVTKEWIYIPKGESTKTEAQRTNSICNDRSSRKENSEEKTEKERLWKEQMQKETGLRKGKKISCLVISDSMQPYGL